MEYYIGIDVGTTSVRAGLVQLNEGRIKVTHTSVHKIKIWNDTPNHYEQSTENIWSSLVLCVKDIMAASNIPASQVKGLGFDATCSLVVLDDFSRPISASTSNDSQRNVIMWMDHRAEEEANHINSTCHELLKFVGGKVSLEMEMPKVLWLKKHLPETWSKVRHLFDLPDFLTYRATGSASRSLCSLVCKWLYDASSGDLQGHGWSDELLCSIDLPELIENSYKILGSQVFVPGEACGTGLTATVAEELGLSPHTHVGTSLIDAHAGGIGMLVCKPSSITQDFPVAHKLGLICGTSTCHMIVSDGATFVPGVWGPYYSAMVPGMWLNEGGQSATGKLIDHIIETHSAFTELQELANDPSEYYPFLANHAEKLASERGVSIHSLTSDLHMMPDFHGNRSPLADPDLKGMICGLTLSKGIDELALLYIATLQSLVFGTKQTVDAMVDCGHDVQVVYMCGGLTKNRLFVQMTADILDRKVVIPDETESVLLGSALMAVCSSRASVLTDVLDSVTCDGTVYDPQEAGQSYYKKKYQVFLMMIEDQLKYRHAMIQS